MVVEGGLAPPMVIGGDKEAGAEMEQAPPWFGRGLSGCQLPGWLVGVCVSVSASTGTEGDAASWALS